MEPGPRALTQGSLLNPLPRQGPTEVRIRSGPWSLDVHPAPSSSILQLGKLSHKGRSAPPKLREQGGL